MDWFPIFRVLIMLVVSLCCAYQFLILSMEYFEMDIVTDVSLSVPESLSIPGVTLCASAAKVVDYKRLKEKHPKLVDTLKKTHGVNQNNFSFYVEDFIQRNLTVKDYFSLVYKPIELFRVETIANSDGYPITDKNLIDEKCDQSVYLKNGWTCFVTNCKSEPVKTRDLALNNDRVLVFLSLNNSFCKQNFLRIYLHSPSVQILDWRNVPAPFTCFRASRVRAMSFQRSQYKRLAQSKKGNCRNYSDEGYQSRSHKVQECEALLARYRLNITLPETTRFDYDESPVGSFVLDKRHKDAMSEIRAECRRMTPERDCIEEYYTPFLDPETHLGSSLNDGLEIKSAFEPEIISVSSPKSTFVNYLTLACSTFAFWFGFSVGGFLIDSLAVLQKRKILEQVKKLSTLRKVRSRKKCSEYEKCLP